MIGWSSRPLLTQGSLSDQLPLNRGPGSYLYYYSIWTFLSCTYLARSLQTSPPPKIIIYDFRGGDLAFLHPFIMNNFGVIEVASVRTTIAPGWAYVPDTSIHPSSQPQPGNRKRARNAPGPSIGDLTARQEAKIRKEVEALERDWGKDNTIPVPVRSGGRGNAFFILLVQSHVFGMRMCG